MTITNSLKDFVKTTIRKVLITAALVIINFKFFLLMRTVNITMKIYTSQSPHVKHYILTIIKIKILRTEKLTEIDLLIGNSAENAILWDSIVKEVKGWDISEKNNKVVSNTSMELLMVTWSHTYNSQYQIIQSVLSCTVVPTTWGKTLVQLKLTRKF